MSDCPTPQRREELREARKGLFKLPRNEWFELAGHPTVYYELRDYREHPLGKEEGIKTARSDVNFMFKAFETGQVRHAAFLTLHHPAAFSRICKALQHSCELQSFVVVCRRSTYA